MCRISLITTEIVFLMQFIHWIDIEYGFGQDVFKKKHSEMFFGMFLNNETVLVSFSILCQASVPHSK
jgi:hypothetical protein